MREEAISLMCFLLHGSLVSCLAGIVGQTSGEAF